MPNTKPQTVQFGSQPTKDAEVQFGKHPASSEVNATIGIVPIHAGGDPVPDSALADADDDDDA